eukprot:14074687-Alexandrium_andersonii.AAC.1
MTPPCSALFHVLEVQPPWIVLARRENERAHFGPVLRPDGPVGRWRKVSTHGAVVRTQRNRWMLPCCALF